MLAFSQWWIRRSGIILDACTGSGTTCNQPARDSWWLSHAVTLAQLRTISTVRALNSKNLCETFMKLPIWSSKNDQSCILYRRWSIFLDKPSPLHHCARNTSQLSKGSAQPRPGSLIHQPQAARHQSAISSLAPQWKKYKKKLWWLKCP